MFPVQDVIVDASSFFILIGWLILASFLNGFEYFLHSL